MSRGACIAVSIALVGVAVIMAAVVAPRLTGIPW